LPTFKDAKSGTAISVKVIPRAKKNEVAGLMGDGSVRIRITAPPVEGAANQALVEFLSQLMNIHKNQIEIVAGLSSERKLITLVGISPQSVEEILHRAMHSAELKRAHRSDAQEEDSL
jgi:uncharacterized protein (TIGR00251 family)